jgi:hypothetical protein
MEARAVFRSWWSHACTSARPGRATRGHRRPEGARRWARGAPAGCSYPVLSFSPNPTFPPPLLDLILSATRTIVSSQTFIIFSFAVAPRSFFFSISRHSLRNLPTVFCFFDLFFILSHFVPSLRIDASLIFHASARTIIHQGDRTTYSYQTPTVTEQAIFYSKQVVSLTNTILSYPKLCRST